MAAYKRRDLRRVVLNSHRVRYYLPDGRFIDRDPQQGFSTYDIYVPGAHPSGCALRVGGAGTLADALEKAGITP